ncbi:CorA metal ion transporter [Lithohypha guttulata]|uniref:CorA metal ion transporter n=1 Tax=Lithohypha guttulata TaxID=1690604 RepID=A0ABR0KBG9_9EURO|nr:CorA metal ion transporter [Lithohypha guttulata]
MQPLPPPPESQPAASASNSGARDQRESNAAPRPQPTTVQPRAGSNADATRDPSTTTGLSKKRRHRGGKKRRNRRQSFAAPPSETSTAAGNMDNIAIDETAEERPTGSFYSRRRNQSSESLESDALLDHRNQQPMRPRKESRLNPVAAQRASISALGRQRSSDDRAHHHHRRAAEASTRLPENDSDQDEADDRTPLMPVPSSGRSPAQQPGYGLFRPNTRSSSRSSARRRTKSSNMSLGQSFPKYSDSPSYDVNNPPSIPGTPHLHASLDDPMMPDTGFLNRSQDSSRNLRSQTATGEALIDIDRQDAMDGDPHSAPPSPRLGPEGMGRQKRAMTFGPDVDVCLPPDVLSEFGEEDYDHVGSRDEVTYSQRRRKRKEWPQLWALDEWSREEKELRAADSRRAQRIQEPVLVDGRLRPRKSAWHREQEPNRFTYFNVEFESTIHAPTVSELVPQGGSFRELFIPEPPVLEESSSSESEAEPALENPFARDGAKTTGSVSPKNPQDETENGTANGSAPRSRSRDPSRLNSILTEQVRSQSRDANKARSVSNSGQQTPHKNGAPKKEKPKRFGERPQFWLDVLNPTAQEMQVMKVAFGIHPLTAEDILQQEAREKVELFKNYYFINYRTFEQDQGSDEFMEPVNVYILVFHHGILTFHFSQIPHPANVRRRIRQLQDYLELTADWISYAIIDDITDVFAPMIQRIEDEVDHIDEEILQSTPGAFSADDEATGDHELKEKDARKKSDGGKSDKSSIFSLPSFLKTGEAAKKKDTSGYNMLRRVGETRKKVMGLYRLLGTKADVIKGFAKRCNEQWDVTPKNEIALYLGDIQDHILTMTSNLNHYETLLSRAHSNYLAQVSIRMNERGEQTGDVLNKLTVFGTIVLPMNIICGMWGMNVKVPGQDIDNLWWFWGITAGLMAFAIACYLLCKKLYGIV